METKEDLKNTIKNWVKIDNEIKTLQEELSKRKKEKKIMSANLMTVMKQNEIDLFDIKDGQLIYSKKDVKKPITQKTLLQLLATYFDDELKANEVGSFIMENREKTTRENIVIKYNKHTDNDTTTNT